MVSAAGGLGRRSAAREAVSAATLPSVTAEMPGEAGDLALTTNEARLIELTAAYAPIANGCNPSRCSPYGKSAAMSVRRCCSGRRLLGRPLSGLAHALDMWPRPKAAVRSVTGWVASVHDFTEHLVAGGWLDNSSENGPVNGIT